MTFNNNESFYLYIFNLRRRLSKRKYFNELIRLFFLDEENIFLFTLIRRELKKLSIAQAEEYEDWILKRFGVCKIYKSVRKKIAFVDHSFHCKTASSMFFIYELEKKFDVDIFWSSRWKGVPDKYLENLYKFYQHAIYWQVLPDLHVCHPRNTLVIPMWDAVYNEYDSFYLKYKDFRFLSFSYALHEKCLQNGIKSDYVKVFPKTLNLKNRKDDESKEPIIYFWQRTDDFTWQDLKTIIAGNCVGKVLLCNAVDPGCSFIPPSTSDIVNYSIEIIPWNKSHAELIACLSSTDIYVAPRKVEGIGFSFIEAIECGCTIICNNSSTMNEYIDDSTGYVVDYSKPMPLDLSEWKKKKESMREKYIAEKSKDINFLEKIEYIAEEFFR
ncbi:glycosyltransferase [Vreelandella sedimenti]|uniref:glycosyltransferase n=1 Tax=Vreelandella sedimenti TaxID=2729618 RepID=UPI0030D82BAA|tara:strand:- start:7184 stop:8335 length:1152 start_codon:yes stop_codon:yes gene_type:complete